MIEVHPFIFGLGVFIPAFCIGAFLGWLFGSGK
jgi:hypothetical protein